MTEHEFQNGDRVILNTRIDLPPYGVFEKGLTGTVMDVSEDPNDSDSVIFTVKLDQHFDSLKQWGNALHVGRDDEYNVHPDDFDFWLDTQTPNWPK
jgi:hypothetical protein